eukprot:Selendium_serpulae@DN1321_c0_g1_i1.p1
MGQLAEFNPEDEKAFEDWLDKTSRSIKTRRVCLPLFQECWAAVSTEAVAATISRELGESYEGLASRVAMELYPHSSYVKRVEDWLWRPPRAPTVHEAVYRLRSVAARYLRLCERRGRQVAICDVKVLDSLLEASRTSCSMRQPSRLSIEDGMRHHWCPWVS